MRAVDQEPRIMKRFKLYYEGRNATAVISYGRYNPPTIGHEKLIKKIEEISKNKSIPGFIIPSHTIDSKKNPLTFEEKKNILKNMSQDITVLDSGSTFLNAIKGLEKEGFRNIIHIAGSDRIPEFSKLIETYNGRPDKSGLIPFTFNTYEFISSGERDPDSEGVEGISASKLRLLAKEGKIEEFKVGLSSKLDNSFKEKIYNIIRERIK